jgi:hypothetical protein
MEMLRSEFPRHGGFRSRCGNAWNPCWLECRRRRSHPGRKPLPWRRVVDEIFDVRRTGCQGKVPPANSAPAVACTATSKT